MMNYQAVMYDPIYRQFGVPGLLAVDSSYDIVVMDKSVPTADGLPLETLSTLPHARVRMVEFLALGLDPNTIDDNTITFNGVTWTIKAHQYVPSPNGRDDGELALILEEV